MNKEDLTPVQIGDIEGRVATAKAFLEKCQLQPTASVSSVNTGDDIFATKIIVYLQDTKYLSPISKKDL